MGAYSLLARRIGMRAAEELILSGKVLPRPSCTRWASSTCWRTDGQGETAVRNWIAKNAKRRNGMQACSRARQFIHPMTREELDGIVELWVDAALRLSDRDLKMMARLVRAQSRRLESAASARSTPARSARSWRRQKQPRAARLSSAGLEQRQQARPQRRLRAGRRSRSGRCGGYPHRPGCTQLAVEERASGRRTAGASCPRPVANASSVTETSMPAVAERRSGRARS
jgi:hypothetical protein